MLYVYMDESWDLWKYWNQKNSKYFFIVFFITKNPRIADQALKKVSKWMKNQKIISKWWVFHANNETQKSREQLLNYTIWKEFVVASCFLNKNNMYGISKDQHLLYNNMVVKLLKYCIDKNIILKWEDIQFYAARKETNKHLNKQFENQIKDDLSWLLNIQIFLRYPHQEKWLQLVDSLAYAIFRKHEYDDYSLYSIIKDNISIETPFLRN